MKTRTVLRLFLITLPLLIGPVCPCDYNLFISSNGMICDQRECNGMNDIASIPMHTGKTICLSDRNDDKFTLKIVKSYDRYEYKHIYDTSEFNLESEQEKSCCTAHDKPTCGMDVKYDKFIDKKDRVQGYTCQTGSRAGCYPEVTCSWIHWWLEPTGNVAKIYKFERHIMEETEISIQYKESIKTIKFDLNNPFDYQLNDVHFSLVNNLKKRSYYSSEDFKKLVIEDNMNFFNADVSPLNFPAYLIEINGNKSAIYSHHNVRCQAGFSQALCTAPKSFLKRFREYPTEKLKSFEIHGEHMWVEKREIESTFDMKISSLNIEKAICDIEKIGGYGCIDCKQKPYVVLKANAIQKEGVIPFESNCTFNRNYVSCSPEPFMLEIKEQNSYCYLYMKSINKTFNIDTDIVIFHEMTSEDPLTTAKMLFLNWDFAGAAIIAMAVITVFGVMVKVFGKNLQDYLFREEIDTIQMQEL